MHQGFMDIFYTGTWLLTAAISTNGAIPIVDGETEEGAVDAWLYGSSHDMLGQTTPAHGLTLSIAADGSFAEEKTSTPALTWFDSEGVLDARVTPFDGVIHTEGSIGYLLLREPISWATPSDPLRATRVRYDDGDMIICDKLELVGEALVRTMSVVTDELYLDRTVLVYRR